MDDATRDQISRLLRQGLNHYGLGEIEAAIACWNSVRELDPENSAALDYLQSANEELLGESLSEEGTRPTQGGQQGPSEGAASIRDGVKDLVVKGLALYRGGRLEEARERLDQAALAEPDRLDIQGYLELVRGQLLKQYGDEIGDQGRSVRLAVTADQLVRLELGPEEGYLLSQIDGSLTIDDLLSLSSVGRSRTLELVARFLRNGLIE